MTSENRSPPLLNLRGRDDSVESDPLANLNIARRWVRRLGAQFEGRRSFLDLITKDVSVPKHKLPKGAAYQRGLNA